MDLHVEKVSEENRNYTKHGFIQEFFDRRETIDNAKHIDLRGVVSWDMLPGKFRHLGPLDLWDYVWCFWGPRLLVAGMLLYIVIIFGLKSQLGKSNY